MHFRGKYNIPGSKPTAQPYDIQKRLYRMIINHHAFNKRLILADDLTQATEIATAYVKAVDYGNFTNAFKGVEEISNTAVVDADWLLRNK